MSAEYKISVRNLVEFILRSGDINRSASGVGDVDAMQEGSRVHRKIQKAQGSGYQAEVPLKLCLSLCLKDVQGDGKEEAVLWLEGRADGVLDQGEHSKPRYLVDEIKGVYQELAMLEAPAPVHRAQAMCYAYMLAKQKEQEQIALRMTYCQLETEEVKYFEETVEWKELEAWFEELIRAYEMWLSWQFFWRKQRDQSIKKLEFPFAYREGQKELAAGVYRSILRKKRLFIEAPTGVGKTISTVFPSIKAMGEGLSEKLFYLTAKTIARTVAESAFTLLQSKGMRLKTVTITAKEKICPNEVCECTPERCERAKGHFDRVNDAVFDVLCSEDSMGRELLSAYAKKHKVCPFEMCLDITTWTDAIICDYNYVFDPEACLKRFMAAGGGEYVFLIDEAHNLVDRAREMYSGRLCKEDFLKAAKLVKPYSRKAERALSACNHDMLTWKRQCQEVLLLEEIGGFAFHLMQLTELLSEFLQANRQMEDREDVLSLYFEILHFQAMYEEMDDKYWIYTDYGEENQFYLHLKCMDPSGMLKRYLGKGRSAVFFSATLLPIRYYREQLGGREDDYAVYAPSPFSKEKRRVFVGTGVSTKYTRRNAKEYQKIAKYIALMAKARQGNYLAFFPSYQLLRDVAEEMTEEGYELYLQAPGMTEEEKEDFLSLFDAKAQNTRIGFCVMGGIFGEGIDLDHDRLIGAAIVGTGLPMVGNERELYREYYEEKKGMGFAYAYLYQGMNKVLQAAGRVIRTVEDRGVILLLDDRFLTASYQELFPREWFPYQVVNSRNLPQLLTEFWESSH